MGKIAGLFYEAYARKDDAVIVQELSSALSRRSFRFLAESASASDGLRDWITAGRYRVDNGSTPVSVRLVDFGIDEIAPFLAYDFQRFSLASLESFASCGVESGDSASFGWIAIKSYYSAFFAAHSLIRASGRGVVRLEADHVKFLNEIIASYSLSQSPILMAGSFKIRIRSSSGGLAEVELSQNQDSGGTHEIFWRYFLSFLSDVESEVASDADPDGEKIVGQITEISNILKAQGKNNGNSLSFMRNEINYRHRYGVWHPRVITRSERDFMLKSRARGSVRMDYEAVGQPLHAFLSSCRCITRLCFDVTSTLVARVTDKRARFPQAWRRFTGAA